MNQFAGLRRKMQAAAKSGAVEDPQPLSFRSHAYLREPALSGVEGNLFFLTAARHIPGFPSCNFVSLVVDPISL